MKKPSLPLEDLWACFQGIVPAALSTCAADGTPNITFISQVYYVDAKHLAISFQWHGCDGSFRDSLRFQLAPFTIPLQIAILKLNGE